MLQSLQINILGTTKSTNFKQLPELAIWKWKSIHVTMARSKVWEKPHNYKASQMYMHCQACSKLIFYS